MFFNLGDGVLAGSSRAVTPLTVLLEQSLEDVGLSLQREKCEIVLASGNAHQIPSARFDGFKFNCSGNFKLLGAPFRSTDFCTEHTRKRKDKAGALLHEIAGLPDPQSAVHLVRQCVSFHKLAHSVRTVPPCIHQDALKEFTADFRAGTTQVIEAEVEACA